MISKGDELFTVLLRCHITGRESEYKISLSSEAEVRQFFQDRPDELLKIKSGWDGFFEWAIEKFNLHQFVPLKPHWVRPDGPWIEPKEFDFRTDLIDTEY